MLCITLVLFPTDNDQTTPILVTLNAFPLVKPEPSYSLVPCWSRPRRWICCRRYCIGRRRSLTCQRDSSTVLRFIRCVESRYGIHVGLLLVTSEFQEADTEKDESDDGRNQAVCDDDAIVAGQVEAQGAIDDSHKDNCGPNVAMDLAHDCGKMILSIASVMKKAKCELDQEGKNKGETDCLMCGIEMGMLHLC